jgi:hypothetical protein
MIGTQNVHALEYIYPVACVTRDSNEYVYFIHQISLSQLQLLQLNLQTNVVCPALATGITPAGIRMLPDNSGYSFIDQGSIFIKYFTKRSPLKIDIDQPLYHMEMIEWIDADTCYFSACYEGQYSIYQLSRLGKLDALVHSDYADCLYPQKIGSHLYYIERSFGKKNYSIKCIKYPLHAINEHACDGDSALLVHESYDQPIAFLSMISPTRGFYVSYPDSIESQAACLSCAYHQLIYDSTQATWISQKIFEFSIPLDFILPDSQDRLHESLLPVLPRTTPRGIYYCSCSDDQPKKTGLRNFGASWYSAERVKIYFYDFYSQKTTLVQSDTERDLLAPLITSINVFYGHSMAQNSKIKKCLPGMWAHEDGQMYYKAPQFLIS